MNNVLHLKYAVEVEKTASISKAAENLYMSQPHLSKAIRELEDSLGIKIFNRTSKGVVVTQRGKEFLSYAKNILTQIEAMEALYITHSVQRQEFSVSVPRASYVSHAFTEFISELDVNKDMNVNYRETNSMRAIKNVADSIDNLAIIRYQSIYEKYFLNALAEKNVKYSLIWEFEYLVLISKESQLAKESVIDFKDLTKYTEIMHGDLTVPALPVIEARNIVRTSDKKKTISVYERASQFELLTRVPTTYMWVSRMPYDIMKRFSLVTRSCNLSKNKYKDILIYRDGYKFTKYDKMFRQKLMETVSLLSKF